MKTTYKIIFLSILILIISTIGFTYWYISDHLLSNLSAIRIQSVIDIAIQIGLVGALIPTFSFLIFYFLIKRINNKWLLFLLIIILITSIIAAIYWFILCAIFHEFNNPILFK